MPHAYRTNVAAVGAAIVASIETFGFTTTSEGKALGMLLAEGTAEGIRERSIERQCDGEGVAWPLNSEPRRRAKYRRMGGALTNVDTGQMLSIASLMGRVIVSQYLVTITYGTGEIGGDGIDGGPAISDDDKSFYAHSQHRGFFQLDTTIKASNFTMFSTALGDHIRNPGR